LISLVFWLTKEIRMERIMVFMEDIIQRKQKRKLVLRIREERSYVPTRSTSKHTCFFCGDGIIGGIRSRNFTGVRQQYDIGCFELLKKLMVENTKVMPKKLTDYLQI